MKISLQNVGKRYNREWVFKDFSFEFSPHHTYGITGPNGSGKSTLLQVLAGAMHHSRGTITYTHEDTGENIENPYPFISISAPYLELIEEMTAIEFLKFHFSFKQRIKEIDEILNEINLSHAMNKQIRFFSSGMKQRLKLAQAFFCNTPALLLDEPLTNLDSEGVALYHQLINQYANDRLLIISSNDKNEYHFCDEIISILDFKK